MTELAVVCRSPFRSDELRTYEAPDLTRSPPTQPTRAMLQRVPEALLAPLPRFGGPLERPRVAAGVQLGPRPRANACIVFGLDASGSVMGDAMASPRQMLGANPQPHALTTEQLHEQQFSAQILAVATALRDPIVQDYALAGPNGGIAVLPLQVGYEVQGFFSADQRDLPACEGWAVLDTREKMNAYADRLLALRRTMRGTTQIGELVSSAADALATCPVHAERRHVNVLVQNRDDEDGRPANQVEGAATGAIETSIHALDLDPVEPMDREALTPYYRDIVGRHGRVEWLGRVNDYVDILRRQLAPPM